ncbi:hypothetical protein T08_13327 [Trichinella sp. T8]|nr:hypothetical protein T08_13327 [Trichinella sp. T8]
MHLAAGVFNRGINSHCKFAAYTCVQKPRQNRYRHHAVTRINLSKLEYLPGLMTLAASCGGETVTLLSLQR